MDVQRIVHVNVAVGGAAEVVEEVVLEGVGGLHDESV